MREPAKEMAEHVASTDSSAVLCVVLDHEKEGLRCGEAVCKKGSGWRERTRLRRHDSSKFENAEAHSVYNSIRAARRRKTKMGPLYFRLTLGVNHCHVEIG